MTTAIALYANNTQSRPLKNSETSQADNAGLGDPQKPYKVVDKQGWGYGHQIAEYSTYEEAFKHSMAAPGTKVVTDLGDRQNQKNRDMQRQHMINTNPDLDTVKSGGQGSGCHGPNCGRHKHAVGDRVRRNPKVAKQWAANTPHNRGVVVSQETGKDNKGRSKLAYRVLMDSDAEQLRQIADGTYKFEDWERPQSTIDRLNRGTQYLEEELVPDKKVKASTTAPVSPGTSLRKRNDLIDTPKVRDFVRRRQVKQNPDVD